MRRRRARARVSLSIEATNDGTDPLALPTTAALGGESASVFSGDLDAARTAGKWVIFVFHSILPTSSNWYANVDVASITGSIDHGKSLGDMWLDTLAKRGSPRRRIAHVGPVAPRRRLG
jgi:hypothetical protein